MFQVRFQYNPGDTYGYDTLGTFPTVAAANQYRTEQLGLEGWVDKVGTESDQYVIVEV